MHAATQSIKPPVPYTDAAIKAGIAHEAANGPAHVRIKALGMMARITGLFEQGKQFAKQAAQQVIDQAHDASDEITRKLNQYMKEAGVTSLADFSPLAKKSKSEQDEDEETAGNEDDDVP